MIEAILSGVPVTLAVSIAGSLLCVVVAIAAGLGRLTPLRAVRFVTGAFIELFRGSSILVQMYVAYYVLPWWGIALSPFWAAVVVLGCNCGAHGADAVRAAIQSVPGQQRDAAAALGLSRCQAYRHIIFPQAFLIFIPSLRVLLVDLVKSSSIVSLVSLIDITFQAEQIRVTTGNSVAAYGASLVVYFVIISVIDIGLEIMEEKAGRHRKTDGRINGGLWKRLVRRRTPIYQPTLRTS